MPNPDKELTVEEARRLVREREETIKLHVIHILLGCPPLPKTKEVLNNEQLNP